MAVIQFHTDTGGVSFVWRETLGGFIWQLGVGSDNRHVVFVYVTFMLLGDSCYAQVPGSYRPGLDRGGEVYLPVDDNFSIRLAIVCSSNYCSAFDYCQVWISVSDRLLTKNLLDNIVDKSKPSAPADKYDLVYFRRFKPGLLQGPSATLL